MYQRGARLATTAVGCIAIKPVFVGGSTIDSIGKVGGAMQHWLDWADHNSVCQIGAWGRDVMLWNSLQQRSIGGQ